jgi:hypothetical protein
MSFRESIGNISPPWLTGLVGGGIQYAEGLVLDALGEWIAQGVKASMPGIGTPDALYLIGRDMQIDRGPNESDAHYAARLQRAVDTWATAGNAGTLLQQLAAYFSPSTTVPIRLVSDRAIWQEIDLTTNVVTQTNVGTNWNWDGTVKWWRGWAIIDSSAGPWTVDLWNQTATWGDGGSWGSTASLAEVAAIQGVVSKWKPANVSAQVIVAFSSTILRRTDTSPANPSGTSDTPLWRTGVNAIFWGVT